jgi:putative nucleotidyltransferase with HDIG domain
MDKNIYETNLSEFLKYTQDISGGAKRKKAIKQFIQTMRISDEETFFHCVNVSLLCHMLGDWVNFKEEDVMFLTIAGMLHDIGKIQIPKNILYKKERLTDAEFSIIKTHAVSGYSLLKDMDFPDDIKLTTLMHHERIDGSGYPDKLTGSKINRFACIVSICDIYDAMTSDRCYRSKVSPFKVIRSLESQSYGALKKEYLMVFLQNIARTFLHKTARLNDGRDCEVIMINNRDLSHPIVKCGNDIIDLSVHNELDIHEV